ncbi:FMN-binding protein, partial [Acidobacteria bacterium AH-259-G07]|nr:FMN-binding protein [Acidobacteria bacterium AH-259-G07]
AASPPVSRKEALSAAFPGAAIHSQRIFLTEKQRERAAALAGVDIPSSLIARYLALEEGREIGRAYVDTHIVRTKKETLLICLDADGNVKRIEVTAFLEPPEYMASRAWYGQYQGKTLDAELNLHRVIRPIAGATLTAMATNEAVRRVLAIDRVLRAAGGAP